MENIVWKILSCVNNKTKIQNCMELYYTHPVIQSEVEENITEASWFN